MRIAMRTTKQGTQLVPAVVKEAFDLVGGGKFMVDADNAFGRTVIFSSEDLTDSQVDEIWNAGELWVADLMFWEADDFNGIISKIKEFVEEQDECDYEDED